MGREAGAAGLSPVLDVEVAKKGKDGGADKIDDQILHGVDQSDIQIAAQSEILPVDGYGLNAGKDNRDVVALRVQQNRADGVQHRIFLHIKAQQLIHGEFEEFPEYAYGHGKRKGNNGHKQRRQVHAHPACPGSAGLPREKPMAGQPETR